MITQLAFLDFSELEKHRHLMCANIGWIQCMASTMCSRSIMALTHRSGVGQTKKNAESGRCTIEHGPSSSMGSVTCLQVPSHTDWETDVLACGQGPRVGQAGRFSPPRHRVFKHFQVLRYPQAKRLPSPFQKKQRHGTQKISTLRRSHKRCSSLRVIELWLVQNQCF